MYITDLWKYGYAFLDTVSDSVLRLVRSTIVLTLFSALSPLYITHHRLHNYLNLGHVTLPTLFVTHTIIPWAPRHVEFYLTKHVIIVVTLYQVDLASRYMHDKHEKGHQQCLGEDHFYS